SSIDLGSKPCACGELFSHFVVGQYCAPIQEAEKRRKKIKPNIDLASIVYYAFCGVDFMSAVLKK
mgnify:CR=1